MWCGQTWGGRGHRWRLVGFEVSELSVGGALPHWLDIRKPLTCLLKPRDLSSDQRALTAWWVWLALPGPSWIYDQGQDGLEQDCGGNFAEVN